MAILKFEADKVKRLIDHALASKLHCATYGQAFELLGDDWATGKVKADVLQDRIPPALHFVKDDGIYIMSNGDPGLKGGEFAQDTESAVVYASGYEPLPTSDAGWNERYEKVRDAVGGDDFVESIDIAGLPPMPPKARFLEVIVLPSRLDIGWIAGTPPITPRLVGRKRS